MLFRSKRESLAASADQVLVTVEEVQTELQIDNLTEIVPADMPYWLEVFGRGETIVIPNIEDVKTQMPSEYEILKTQSVNSEIAVPVFYRGNLSGFFGLDNPQRAMTAGSSDCLPLSAGISAARGRTCAC